MSRGIELRDAHGNRVFTSDGWTISLIGVYTAEAGTTTISLPTWVRYIPIYTRTRNKILPSNVFQKTYQPASTTVDNQSAYPSMVVTAATTVVVEVYVS